jgi:hypothetical protein
MDSHSSARGKIISKTATLIETMNTTSQRKTPSTILPGRWRGLYRTGWLALVGLMVTTFVIAIPFRFRSLMTPFNAKDWTFVPELDPALTAVAFAVLSSEEIDDLESLGLSHEFYSGYILTFEVALMLACVIIAGIIFWRRSDDWLALWISLIMVVLGTLGPFVEVPNLAMVWPSAGWMLILALPLGMISHLHLLFLSPDGRFVPRWSLKVGAGFSGMWLGLVIFIATVIDQWGLLMSLGPFFLAFLIWFAMLGLGVYCQVYRYRHVSGPAERQQTKWVGVGLAAVALGFGVNAVFLFLLPQVSGLPRVLYNLARPPLVDLFMLLFPISLAFSILRYRLWDIDLIIRRTLIYTALTGTLALVYFVSVILLQRLLPTQTQLATILSTLAIAALFSPLRARIQKDIDRLFFRRKYDTEQTLAAFNAAVRNEVDLNHLSESLLTIVEDTMQPERVALWIKTTNDQ